MQIPEFLHLNADGEICLKGHRIRLIDVAARYEEGHSAESIVLGDYPTLNLALVHKVIAFYLENEAETRRLMEDDERELARLASAAGSAKPSLQELRERMEQQRKAKAS